MSAELFQIPEIMYTIGGYLGSKDVKNCTQVCKLWKETLYPLVHQAACVSGYQPPDSYLKNHLNYIKHISFRCVSEEKLHLGYCNLRSFSNHWSARDGMIEGSTKIITDNTSTLRKVEFRENYLITPIWRALTLCHNLDVISLTGVSIDRNDIDLFLLACSYASELKLHLHTTNKIISPVNPPSSSIPHEFKKLRKFICKFNCYRNNTELLQVLSRAVNVKHLELYNLDGKSNIISGTKFCHQIQ
jgi:hypothetical protein